MGSVTLYGKAATTSVAKEIIVGGILGLAGGLSWKYWHWTDRQRVETYYAKVAKKEASS
eukprot:CAMPEP_0168618408 /NCGR_PEP_ID=MMETSP0449_2-20121227/6058_1 /TAXON_ID=1082188 /ORGANISM="Strombidium rassoulzadegani, Strain ras09" /LENGTH=58 /DNA_ID=CAMNT_0008659285 /DNA_START=76 /DNA_END=252 /DNA_ORIENTATION=-